MKAEHESGKLALAMIDIDHFKAFNDTYGHLDGDACLTKVGDVLKQVANEVKGFGARYGGEEFALVLPGADAARMAEVGEMIRAGIEALGLPHGGAPLGRITVSVGVAATSPVAGPKPARPGRGRRCRALHGQAARPEHGGRARRNPLGRPGHGAGGLRHRRRRLSRPSITAQSVDPAGYFVA